MSQCRIEGESHTRGPLTRGLCRKHYVRWQRHGDPTISRFADRDPATKLRQLTEANAETGCLEALPRTRNKYGYGAAQVNGRLTLLHRLAYELANGPIPDGLHVCHRCDNPPCCNPAHLFLGTDLDNMRDAKAKGRLVKGSAHVHARLTESDVIAIRDAINAGARTSDLAQQHGLSESAISHIKYGRTWSHLRSGSEERVLS